MVAERRRRREERREKKSPGEDKAALLTIGERRVLVTSIRDLAHADGEETGHQLGSLRRELSRDDASRRRGASR